LVRAAPSEPPRDRMRSRAGSPPPLSRPRTRRFPAWRKCKACRAGGGVEGERRCGRLGRSLRAIRDRIERFRG